MGKQSLRKSTDFMKQTILYYMNIKRDVTKWSTMILDLTSRIKVVKMNLLQRLLYLFLSYSLPVRISEGQFSAWDKMTSRPRVRLKALHLSKEGGGLALPHFKAYYYPAQLRNIVYLFFKLLHS